MRFPLTLGARGSCTIGGLTSTNAGGTQVLKFGTMRALVAGVEAVLPDGSIHNGLSGLKKDNRGYSLDQLLIGAEGTLGVITAVALRLVPAVAARAVAWAGVDSPAQRARPAALPRGADRQRRRLRAGAARIASSSSSSTSRTRARRCRGSHPWHVLVEATTADADARHRAASSSGCSRAALEAGHHRRRGARRQRSAGRGLLEAPRHASPRPSAPKGQTLAHDISVAGRRHARASSSRRRQQVERAFPASSPAASAISATATSISTSAPAATPRPTGTSAKARRSRASSTISSPPPAARSPPSTASAS